MLHPMNFQMPTDEEIHTAFAQGEAAVLAVFHAVATQVAALAQQLAQQGAVLQELQARLAKSSHNSSKPPASDGYGAVKRTASLRKAGDKPNGGQPGHEGQTLMAVEHPERTVTDAVPRCAHCHASLHDIEVMGEAERQGFVVCAMVMALERLERRVTHAFPRCAHCHASLHDIEVMGYEERQGFDLPAIRIEVMAHRAEIKVCPACGKSSKGTFPDAVTQAVQYGPTVHTWAAYFTNHHHIPVERTTEIFADLVQHQLSEATVLKASEHLDTCIAPSTEAVKGLLRTAAVLHVDESGLRVR